MIAFAITSPLFAFANVVGTDAQNFNPTTDGLDFVTVHSSETLEPGIFNMGAYVNEAWDALPRFKGQPGYDDRLLGLDLNFGVGLASRWDAGISVPFVLDQSITSQSGFSGRYSQNGVTEMKINTKYRLFGYDESGMNGGLALVASTNLNFIRNNPYTGANAGPTFNLEAAYDRMFGKVAAAVNFGYRWRDSGTPIAGLPIQPFKNQWIASLAGNYPIPSWDSKLIAEVFGSVPASRGDADEDRQQSSLEMLLGMKHDFSHHLAGHVGMGRELISGLASPDWRAYVGLNLQFGPVFDEKTERVEEAIVPVQTSATEETFTLRKITFAFNSAELSPQARPILDELSAYLKRIAFAKLAIEGHTDSIGNNAYNQHLSEMRARSIRDDLIKTYGFDGAKIQAIGFGETMPIADNGNYQGRELNRRVEFRLAK